MAMPNKLIAVDIFSSRALCSHLKFQLGFINYKGVRNPEFQEIGRNKAELLSGDEVAAFRHPSMLSVSAFRCGIFRVLSAAKLRVNQSEAAKASLECARLALMKVGASRKAASRLTLGVPPTSGSAITMSKLSEPKGRARGKCGTGE